MKRIKDMPEDEKVLLRHDFTPEERKQIDRLVEIEVSKLWEKSVREVYGEKPSKKQTHTTEEKRETDLLKMKIRSLEMENQALRNRVSELEGLNKMKEYIESKN